VADHLDRVQKKRQSARLDALIDGRNEASDRSFPRIWCYIEAAQAGSFAARSTSFSARAARASQRREADQRLRMRSVRPGERIVVRLADA